MVDKNINDMFEQRQNTGKRASLAEKYANAVGQLSDANDRAAHAEHDLQVDACKRAAMMYSLFGACKVLDKNPERWLCHVLNNIDSTPKDKLYTLLPEFWEDEEQQTFIGISK